MANRKNKTDSSKVSDAEQMVLPGLIDSNTEFSGQAQTAGESEKDSSDAAGHHSILHEVMRQFAEIDYIRPEDIPDIPLYMDQITSLMDSKLKSCKRYPDDKILTKTMINNYTKNKLIPPPVRKKYSKEHLILLIFVYYMKDFLSINDIEKILKPLEDHHFQKEEGLSMSDIYERACEFVKGQTDYMSRDLFHRWKVAKDVFPESEGKDKEYLDSFAFICLLSFDVYVKKQMIERLIDFAPYEQDPGKKK